jgi:hypothetical protein
MTPLDIHKTFRDTNKPSFKALIMLSNVFYTFGWLLVGVGIIAAVAMYNDLAAMAILIGIGIAFAGLMSLAFGELIKLFLQIEENTRK